MIQFLTSLTFCEMPGILRIIYFIRVLLKLICFIVPIGLLVMMGLDFFKSVTASSADDMNKNTKLSIKRVIFCVAIFFVPTIVNLVIDIIYDSTGEEKSFLSCYENANLDDIAKYQAIYDAELKAEEDENTNPDNITSDDDNYIIPGNGSSGSSKLPSYDRTIYIGDSRTVQMGIAVKLPSCSGSDWTECTIALGSQALSWLKSTAVPTLKQHLNNDPRVNVVINMGTNDMLYGPEQAVKYAEVYNQLAEEYPDTKFVIISVTQIDDSIMASKGYTLRDSHAVNFNKKLKSSLDSGLVYCDVYSKLAGKYETDDGVHYTWATYEIIYDEIKKCL